MRCPPAARLQVKVNCQGHCLQTTGRLGFKAVFRAKVAPKHQRNAPPKPTVSLAVIQERTRQQRKRPVRGTGPGAEEHWGATACSAQRSATCPFRSEPPTLSLSSESLPPEKPEAYLSSGQLPILPCSYQLPDPSSGMSSVTYPLQPQPLGSPCPCCC